MSDLDMTKIEKSEHDDVWAGGYKPLHAHEDGSNPLGIAPDGTYGFWDETWSNWHGNYPDEDAARAALEKYCRDLEGPPPPVRLIWATLDADNLVGYMARVSNSKATPDDPAERLIGFLLRNHHWSPFEMVNMCIEVNTERDISAQILRHSKEHRYQEFSTRYAEVEELRWGTECRFQDAKNRQNSFSAEEVASQNPALDAPVVASRAEQVSVDQIVSYFDALVNEARARSMEGYQWALEHGVAKECARRILPIGLIPTKLYINSNARGWIHYLAERTKPGVQKEHREIALAIQVVFAETFPLIWQAVETIREEEEAKAMALHNVEAMFSKYCGVDDWRDRYPDSTLAEALAFNLPPLDDLK